jgi:hypothetical protein
LKGARLAAIADVGAVFSEMKFSVVPANCFHSSPATGLAVLAEPPQPPSHSAAPPAPAILSTSRLEYGRSSPPRCRAYPWPCMP